MYEICKSVGFVDSIIGFVGVTVGFLVRIWILALDLVDLVLDLDLENAVQDLEECRTPHSDFTLFNNHTIHVHL